MKVINLPERLREEAESLTRFGTEGTEARLMREAADEIERLRADNHRLKTILKGSEEDYSYLFDEDEEEE